MHNAYLVGFLQAAGTPQVVLFPPSLFRPSITATSVSASTTLSRQLNERAEAPSETPVISALKSAGENALL